MIKNATCISDMFIICNNYIIHSLYIYNMNMFAVFMYVLCIMNAYLYYCRKTSCDYSTEPLAWSSSNVHCAIKLKMKYSKAIKWSVKVTKACTHKNSHRVRVRMTCFILLQELSLVWVTFAVFRQPCWCPRTHFSFSVTPLSHLNMWN